MKRRRTLYQRKRRGEWHPAVEWLRVPWFVVVVLVTLPVTFPLAMIQQAQVERRRRRRASQTACARCGAWLGEAALERADTEWSAYVDTLHREMPGTRFRLVRHLWAVCVSCGQEFGYDEAQDAFVRR